MSTWRVDHRSLVLRALAVFLYCYGAILAPTLHQAFHHSDHIHLGESIVHIPDSGEEGEGAEGRAQKAATHPARVCGGLLPSALCALPSGADRDDADHDHHHDHADDHHHAGDHDVPHPHDDHEHGVPSLWHFGAALGENANRVPTVTADRVLVWIAGAPRAERPRTVAVLTPRLRGPPAVSPARV